jgi:hypothetical protein
MWTGQIHHSFRPFLLLATWWRLVGLPESSGGQIRSFLCRCPSIMILHAHISPRGRTVGSFMAAVQRRSLTPSTWWWWWSSSSSPSLVQIQLCFGGSREPTRHGITPLTIQSVLCVASSITWLFVTPCARRGSQLAEDGMNTHLTFSVCTWSTSCLGHANSSFLRLVTKMYRC